MTFGFPCQCSAAELQLPPATTLNFALMYVTALGVVLVMQRVAV